MMPFFQTMLPDDMHQVDPDDVVAAVLAPINKGIDGKLSINRDGHIEFSMDQETVQHYAGKPNGFWCELTVDDLALLQAVLRLPR